MVGSLLLVPSDIDIPILIPLTSLRSERRKTRMKKIKSSMAKTVRGLTKLVIFGLLVILSFGVSLVLMELAYKLVVSSTTSLLQ
jgi:hypothetical protein